MTAITTVLFPDAEAWLKENMENMPQDNVCSIGHNKLKLDGKTHFFDGEDESDKSLEMSDFVKALQLLCDQIGKTLFVGCLTNPHDLLDLCNWDPEVTDAFYQLAYHGEVIYG